MAAVSSCPKCDAQVSLPRNADPGWLVRCPLCHNEFPLRDALAKAPPELIVVDRSGEMSGVDVAPDQRAAEVEAVATVESPAVFEDGFEALTAVDTTAETSDASSAETPFGAEGQAVLALQMARAASAEAALSARGGRRRRGRHVWVARLASIVGGGMAGLAIGYVALLWLGGPPRDFLQLGPKLPAFLVPASFHTMVAERGSQPVPRSHRAPTGDKAPASDTAPEPPTGATGHAVTTAAGTQTAADHPSAPPWSASANPLPATPPPNRTPHPRSDASTRPARTTSRRDPRVPVPTAATFSTDAMERAMAAARGVRHDLATGSLADSKMRRAMGNAYRQLCRLAEAITFPAASADPDRAEQLRQAAAQLVLGLTQRQEKQHELAVIADRWIDSPKRSGSGVVLAGRVESVRRTDDRYVIQVDLAGQRTVTVVAATRPPVHIGDEAIVLGSLVPRPAEQLTGYRGNEAMVVWAGITRAVGGLRPSRSAAGFPPSPAAPARPARHALSPHGTP